MFSFQTVCLQMIPIACFLYKKVSIFELNEELKKILDWMRIDGLTLNVAKTQVLQIVDSQEHILFLSQSSIEKQSCLTYLGVKIDENWHLLTISMNFLQELPNIC